MTWKIKFARAEDGSLIGRSGPAPGVPPKVVLNRALRDRLAEAQNWRCCYCGKHMDYAGDDLDCPSFEHVTPRSKGGIDVLDNLVIACVECNNRRGDGLPPPADRLEDVGRNLDRLSKYLFETNNVPGRKRLANLLRDALWLYSQVKTDVKP